MKRVSLLVLLSAVLVLTACTAETGAPGQAPLGDDAENMAAVPGRPTIQMTVGDTVYDGLASAFCWFQAANDIKCEPGPLNPEPSEVISVNPGDMVTFAVGSETDIPTRLTVTLLDDIGMSGDPQVIELENALAADFTINLDTGPHRLSVVAEFSATESDINFVTSVFAVEVAAALAMEPTTEPATDQPAATDLPTEEPTEAPTEEPTAAATATSLPTEVPATDAPTALPPTAVPTTVPPTRAPSATPAPRPTSTPTSAPVQAPALSAPQVVIVKGDDRYTPSSVEVCSSAGEDCTTISNAESAPAVSLLQGDTVRVDSADGGPASMIFTVTSLSGTQVLDRVDIPGNPVALYTATTAPGSYLLKLETVWPSTSVTYYFRLEITG